MLEYDLHFVTIRVISARFLNFAVPYK